VQNTIGNAAAPAAVQDDFELDVTFAPKGSTVAALKAQTSDNCGQTNQSACVGCVTD
jgi:FxLD family lantipeptide